MTIVFKNFYILWKKCIINYYMQQKLSNSERKALNIILLLQFILKKVTFNKILEKTFLQDPKMYRYVSNQSLGHIRWFLAIDKFNSDSRKRKIVEEKQLKPNINGLNQNKKLKKQKLTQPQKQQPHSISSHSVHSKSSIIPNEQEKDKKEYFSHLIPIWALEQQDSIIENELEIDDQIEDEINQIRQRKTKKQIFKTKMQQSRYRFYKIQTNKSPLPQQKKQRCSLVQHYIDMEINFRQSQRQSGLKKVPKFAFRQKTRYEKSLNNSRIKQFGNNNSGHTVRQWQSMKTQQRQLFLQPVNQMKLTPGVTTRESTSRNLNLDYNYHPGNTKKKLQFLKNSELNPTKIKLTQLMSYKKLGTLTHIAYCSSMKTFKEIKENIQSSISIQSKQGSQADHNISKKQIKIENRRIFEELVGDQYDGTSKEASHIRNKLKLKKQGKVRFDNFIQI